MEVRFHGLREEQDESAAHVNCSHEGCAMRFFPFTCTHKYRSSNSIREKKEIRESSALMSHMQRTAMAGKVHRPPGGESSVMSECACTYSVVFPDSVAAGDCDDRDRSVHPHLLFVAARDLRI